MSTDLPDIRRVSVEFLRPGPSHNQLLSPYTQYLGVCNDAGAAVVNVPYEQRVFERRLKDLRYETGEERDRLDMLHEVGRDMGRILEAVPGFTGAVTGDPTLAEKLVHLRLTLSAAELALLPFELAEVPVGSTASAVSVQARPPVVVTRHIRTVPFEGVKWPEKPRILFVASDRKDVPFLDHWKALTAAIQPFRYPREENNYARPPERPLDEAIESFDELLTVMVAPTLVDLQRECQAHCYTHIHVLTHGDVMSFSSERYGVILRNEYGETDIVSGERFVSAITRPGHRPAVVTIASCDSGNGGSVTSPGASFAHAIHQAGVPLVVGSQFPLTQAGSVPLTKRLYEGLLWGQHPLRVLQQVRAELHAKYGATSHDWASIVVYESLPPTLDEQVGQLHYAQAKLAMNAALQHVDIAVASKSDKGTPAPTYESIRQLRDGVAAAVDRLPRDGEFTVECLGLRASASRRLAQAAFTLSGHAKFERGDPIEDQLSLLDQSGLDYAKAVSGLLVNDGRAIQRKATLHWVLIQLISVRVAQGQPPQKGEWEAAKLATTHYLEHPNLEERAWAHASMAELWLLSLAGELSEADVKKNSDSARSEAEELNRAYPGMEAFPVTSTRRQFERYTKWWGLDEFSKAIQDPEAIKRRDYWNRNGLLKTAQDLIGILTRKPAPRPKKGGGGGGNGRGSNGGGNAPTSRTTEDPEPEPGLAPTEPGPTPGGMLGAAQPAHRTAAAHGGSIFTLDALPAGHGDCLWIEYGDPRAPNRILIDCGTEGSSKALIERIDGLPAHGRAFELFVMTHIDADHIGGALHLLGRFKRDLRFNDLWFNGWRHVNSQLGAKQGEMFSTLIEKLGLPWNLWRNGDAIVTGAQLPTHTLPGGMELTLLSPTPTSLAKLAPVWKRELQKQGLEPGGRVDIDRFLKGTPSTLADAAALQDIKTLAETEFKGDKGAPNGSSIALLAEYGGKSMLLTGDAHAPVLVDSIKTLLRSRGGSRLKLDVFKVSHHGSQNNLSKDLLDLIDCPRYLISTNGDHFYHPDRQALARILAYGGGDKEIYFNYRNRYTEVWGSDELKAVREKYHCKTAYPPVDHPGIGIRLL